MHSLICCLAALVAADDAYLAWTVEPAGANSLPATIGQRLTAAELTAPAGRAAHHALCRSDFGGADQGRPSLGRRGAEG